MEHPTRTSQHPIVILAAIAVIVFSAAGVAAIMGWIPSSRSDAASPLAGSAPAKALPAQPAAVHARPRSTAAAAPSTTRNKTPVAVASVRCTDCGVIASILEVRKAGEGTGLGVVGGAVAGGVLGNQVGRGTGKDLMTVAGVVAGGIAGNEIEKRIRTGKIYQVSVRMTDGSTQLITESSLPAWRVGDRVRLIDGRIQAG